MRRNAIRIGFFCALIAAAGAASAAGADCAAEAAIGADGATAALFFGAEGPWSAGFRVGWGFELADLRWDDKTFSGALRYRFLRGERAGAWAGAELGIAEIETGYDRYALPFAGASAGSSLRVAGGVLLFAEAGARFGRADRKAEERIDFLLVRYRETVFIDPLILRFGVSWTPR